MSPHLKKLIDWASGLVLGGVGAWLLFGNPPTGALILIILIAGAVAWVPRLSKSRRRRRKDLTGE